MDEYKYTVTKDFSLNIAFRYLVSEFDDSTIGEKLLKFLLSTGNITMNDIIKTGNDKIYDEHKFNKDQLNLDFIPTFEELNEIMKYIKNV